MTPQAPQIVTQTTIHGLGQPLVDVAAVLYVQDRPSYAKSLQEAAWVCEQVALMPDVVTRLDILKKTQ